MPLLFSLRISSAALLMNGVYLQVSKRLTMESAAEVTLRR